MAPHRANDQARLSEVISRRAASTGGAVAG